MLNRNIIYFVFIGFFFGRSYSNFDLFMNETETKRILGIPGSLFYVRNGVANDYALSFNLPIKSNIDEIYFSWQNLRIHPIDATTMTYTLAVHVSSPAMGNTVASIPLEGTVPSKPSVFSISLRCTGLLVAEVDIKIQLNVTVVSASNLTALEIKRKKTCIKGHTQHPSQSDNLPSAEDLDLRSVQNGSSLYSVSGERDGLLGPGSIFYIIIGTASGAIFLLGFALVIFYCRSQNSNSNDICDANVNRSLRDQGNAYIRSDTPTSNSVISGGTYRGPLTFPYTELRLCDVESILTEIQLSRSHVNVTDILLEGTFGRICRGTVTVQGYNSLSQKPVLVKTLTDQARNDEMEDMMKRGCLMRTTDHENVASVMAAVLDFPPLLIYADSGTENLKKFLLRCRASDQVLNAHQLVCIAIQLSRGLQHLHRRRILHRDLATRNCLVDSRLSVRICDSALSRDIFPGDYHRLGNGESRPVKWMAIESLTEGKYSTACDVWSFGVTMWELFTLGHQPYMDIDPLEMVNYLCDGFRLVQPLNCPNEIFQVMFGCWMLSPFDRLRLTQLQSTLQDLCDALAKYV